MVVDDSKAIAVILGVHSVQVVVVNLLGATDASDRHT